MTSTTTNRDVIAAFQTVGSGGLSVTAEGFCCYTLSITSRRRMNSITISEEEAVMLAEKILERTEWRS